MAARVLERLRIAPDGAGSDRAGEDCIETELAAVLPFDLPGYRASRAPDFHPEFDRQAARCAYVIVADGIYDKPDPVTDPDPAAGERLALASQRRGRAYRAQSALLLRHADLLVAAADPSAPAKPGGTLETVPAALACDLPVLFIDTVRGEVWLIRPAEDLAGALAGPPFSDADLADLVTAILVGPDLGLAGADQDERRAHREGLRLLKDYRARATALNYHYSGLYRGAFVLNYGLAVAAVALATAGLALLAVHHGAHWLPWALLGLAAAKLWLLIIISRGVSPTDPADPAPQILTLAPAAALDQVRAGWIAEQIAYHDRTQGLMHRLDRFAEQASARLSQAVIWVVAFDLLLLVLYLTHRLPWADWIKHDLAPWLIFLAAVLPAAVASCNGLRFQGETRRLAERVAADCLHEVADWSVLYAKELPET
ncbi:hypothetical protein [uncultured Thiodictyon sp.]|uniref:hypothetical protein n=1 Tax=uncultured Thiodictyon sp. TaxID=1846217 RepID=UPI0025DB3E97|nr:hypothetical protein [uncultured Thiodictyon sp.]